MQTRSAALVDVGDSPHARLRSVGLGAVTLHDTFWQPRRDTNRTVTLPSQHQHLEETGRLDNFRRASGKRWGLPFQGIFFNDSDVYKWLEAASSTLATADDPVLRALVEQTITDIADAQQLDGYLNTYFMFDKAGERWANLRDKHELYCAGHLIQAAVAHHRGTGGDRFLNVARRLADHICAIFGPEAQHKREQTDGHPEIEMALVELYRTTRDPRYLQQAQFFIDVRGRGTIGGQAYHQDHQPLRTLATIDGHAVRALYLDAGVTDLVLETGEDTLRAPMQQRWENMTRRRMYVTGGLGSRWEGEAFGGDYELPSARAYAETCAAIASVQWNARLLLLNGDARYADLLEHTLYNAVLPGLSLDGRSYFYQNPLANDGTHRRQPWFGCACCPPNVARLLAQLPGYFYGVSPTGVWTHLYAEGTADITLSDGRVVQITQRTRYPWDGDIALDVDGKGTFTVFVRIPAWCENATLAVNDEPQGGAMVPGTYAALERAWDRGDTIHLRLPMPVRRITSHPYLLENAGRVALMRGPLVYCLEAADHPDVDLRDVVLPSETKPAADFHPDLLGGVVVLRGQAEAEPPEPSWRSSLYQSTTPQPQTRRPLALVAVPYYTWANREPGSMQVWLRAR